MKKAKVKAKNKRQPSYVSTGRHKEISGRLRAGAVQRVYGRYDLLDDAEQAGWVNILSSGKKLVSIRKLSSIGQTAGKTLSRREARYVPAIVEFDDGEETLTPLAPWDRETAEAYHRTPSVVPPANISISDEVALLFKGKAPHPCGGSTSAYEAYVHELKQVEFRGLLGRLARENPAQHRLLLAYFAGVRRGRAFSKKTSNRVAAIVEKLRRWAGLGTRYQTSRPA